MSRSLHPLALALILITLTTPAAAQPPRSLPGAEGEINVTADRLEQIGQDGLLVATGNVEIIRGPSRLRADRVELNRETGEAVAQGNVVFFDGEDRLTGERVDFNFKSGTGVIYDGFAFSPRTIGCRGSVSSGSEIGSTTSSGGRLRHVRPIPRPGRSEPAEPPPTWTISSLRATSPSGWAVSR